MGGGSVFCGFLLLKRRLTKPPRVEASSLGLSYTRTFQPATSERDSRRAKARHCQVRGGGSERSGWLGGAHEVGVARVYSMVGER